jgi:hypothetical protein
MTPGEVGSSSSSQPRSGFLAFWTTLPGVLTAAAAVITAVGGFIAAVVAGQSSSPASASYPKRDTSLVVDRRAWISGANRACTSLITSVSRLDTPADTAPDSEVGDYLRAIANDVRVASQQIAGLVAQDADRPAIDDATIAFEGAAHSFDLAAAPYYEPSVDQATLATQEEDLNTATRLARSAGTSLGALGAQSCATLSLSR